MILCSLSIVFYIRLWEIVAKLFMYIQLDAAGAQLKVKKNQKALGSPII